MVAESPTVEPESPPIRGRSAFQRMTASALHVAELQSKILLLRAKLTVRRVAFYAGLFAVALLLGLLGLVFLYIGVFQVIATYLGAKWTFLIYGGFHVIEAVVIAWIGKRILQRGDEDREPPHSAPKSDAPAHAPTQEGSP